MIPKVQSRDVTRRSDRALNGDSTARAVFVGLEGCRILRPPYLVDDVEITIGDASPRGFPARVGGSLGVCVKWGPDHEVLADGTSQTYARDAVSLRAPGCVWASEPTSASFVSIDVFPPALPEDGVRGSMAFVPRKGFPDVARMAASMVSADSELRAQELVVELVDAALGAADLHSDEWNDDGIRHSVVRAREFLVAHVAERPTLTQAAEAAGVNPFVLVRRFRAALGTTPHAYLVLARLDRARALLARGVDPLDVAITTGFSDQAHLGRWFKRVHGVTPSAYARQVRSVHATSQFRSRRQGAAVTR